MKKLLLSVIASIGLLAQAQTVLTNFEDVNNVTISTEQTKESLFKMMPAVVDNPDVTGINTTDKCLGATNIANADWSGNLVCLKLNEPVVINAYTRYMSLMLWRGVQAKDCRIAINGYEDDNEVYREKLANTGQWERVVIDLGFKHLNDTLNEIYIVYSCNWDMPRRGWTEASYYIDEIALSPAGNIPQADVVIDASRQYQTIHHFGSSDAWTMEFVGKYWSNDVKAKASKQLFSQQFDANGNPEGIGLSGWRFNVGTGSADQGDDSKIDMAKRTECFMNADGTWDWTRQAGQRYFMEQAKNYGCENFIFFSNSAPIFMTKNGYAHADGSGQCNLATDKMPAFADFLVTTAGHFIKEGYNVSLISPVNEPQYDWGGGQEGSPWENIDISNLARALDTSIKGHGISSKILIPEAGQYDRMWGGSGRACNQLSQLFNSKVPNTYIGDLESLAPYAAGHSYWTYTSNYSLKDARMKVRDAAENVGMTMMQTEFSFLEVPQQGTGFPSGSCNYMDYAIYMAKVIHSDLVYGNMAAWNYWTTMAQEQYSQLNRFYLMRMRPKGGDYGSILEGGTIDDNKNLWALGNYSFFLRPGYKRLNLTGGDEMNNVLASAWIAPDSTKLVVVYINTASVRRYSSIKVNNLDYGVTDIKKYVTYSASNLGLSTTETTMNRVLLPARSVSTVVITLDKEPSGVAGDVNGDGEVDVTDVNILINILLGKDDAAKYSGRADVDGNGEVDITDVNIVINKVLGK